MKEKGVYKWNDPHLRGLVTRRNASLTQTGAHPYILPFFSSNALREGKIKPGESVLVEPTSGNTGIALAFIARERGYRCILTMPETMSVERRLMLLSLGAEVVLTPKETAVPGALAKAKEIIEGLGGKGYMLNQFSNPANPKVGSTRSDSSLTWLKSLT